MRKVWLAGCNGYRQHTHSGGLSGKTPPSRCHYNRRYNMTMSSLYLSGLHSHQISLDVVKQQISIMDVCKYAATVGCHHANTHVNMYPTARHLKLQFDSGLNFNWDIRKVFQSCFNEIRSVATIKPVLSKCDLWKSCPCIYFQVRLL